MDASFTAVSDVRPLEPLPARAALGQGAVIALVGLLATVSVVVCQRRLAGALEEPLSLVHLVTTCAIATMIAYLARVAWRTSAAAAPDRVLWVVRVMPSAALLALVLALAIPGTSAVGLWLVGGIVVVEEVAAWWLIRPDRPPLVPVEVEEAVVEEVLPPLAPAAESIPTEPVDIADEQLSQQWTRRQMTDGSEVICGLARATFDTGVRTATVHVAFCPPFEGLPQIVLEETEEFDVRVKTGQLLPYGARFDLKLARAAEQPISFLLRFEAVCQPEPRDDDSEPVTDSENRRVDGPHQRR